MLHIFQSHLIHTLHHKRQCFTDHKREVFIHVCKIQDIRRLSLVIPVICRHLCGPAHFFVIDEVITTVTDTGTQLCNNAKPFHTCIKSLNSLIAAVCAPSWMLGLNLMFLEGINLMFTKFKNYSQVGS